MSLSRKDFLKKLCLSGICLCGFGPLAFSEEETPVVAEVSFNQADEPQDLMQDWLKALLTSMDKQLNEETKRTILKSAAIAHYNQFKMDQVLAPFVGNLDKFIIFLQDEWHWKIDYNKTTRTLFANENKPVCVCPLLKKKTEIETGVICYCSEGFSEKMFSTVAGAPVKVRVDASVLRGDPNCIYRVEFPRAHSPL